MKIAFCDFDGTISKEDVTDLVLEKFALPKWHDIEEEWASGEINSAQCMRLQVGLIRASIDEIDAFLDTIEIDPGFAAFWEFCRNSGVDVVVASDGVDHFIRRILANHGMSDIEVIANHLVWTDGARGSEFRLQTPFAASTCRTASGVCKCAVIAACDEHLYVGDGRSDFCVAHQACIVFAKKKLAEYCDSNRIDYLPYQGFSDVKASLASILQDSVSAPLEHPPIRLNQPDRKAAAPANESGAFAQRPDVSIWSANALEVLPQTTNKKRSSCSQLQ